MATEHEHDAMPPVVKTQMLIRRSAQETFEAFVDPAITTRFWFTESSGRLEPGATVEWTFGSADATGTVHVKEIETAKRIVIDWGEPTTRVEWRFTPRPGGATLVTITETGFSGTPDVMVAHALDSTGGFTQVLCALKALLEHDVELNVVHDHLEAAQA
jgi:uncharacterized protein YndB with AHSA1/START domain